MKNVSRRLEYGEITQKKVRTKHLRNVYKDLSWRFEKLISNSKEIREAMKEFPCRIWAVKECHGSSIKMPLCCGFSNIDSFFVFLCKTFCCLTVFVFIFYISFVLTLINTKIVLRSGPGKLSPRKISIHSNFPRKIPTWNIPTHVFKHFIFSLLSPLSLILLKRLLYFCLLNTLSHSCCGLLKNLQLAGQNGCKRDSFSGQIYKVLIVKRNLSKIRHLDVDFLVDFLKYCIQKVRECFFQTE